MFLFILSPHMQEAPSPLWLGRYLNCRYLELETHSKEVLPRACQTLVQRTGCLLLAAAVLHGLWGLWVWSQQLQLSFTYRAFSAALSRGICYMRFAMSLASCIYTGGQLPTSLRRKEIGVNTEIQGFRQL